MTLFEDMLLGYLKAFKEYASTNCLNLDKIAVALEHQAAAAEASLALMRRIQTGMGTPRQDSRFYEVHQPGIRDPHPSDRFFGAEPIATQTIPERF